MHAPAYEEQGEARADQAEEVRVWVHRVVRLGAILIEGAELASSPTEKLPRTEIHRLVDEQESLVHADPQL